MLSSKYYYNPKTCQYERVRLRWSDAFIYGAGLIVTASVFFIAILFLQNKIVRTDKEIALRRENGILKKHKLLVSAELDSIETTLVQLQTKDDELSLKLFDTDETYLKEENSSTRKSDILFADASGFQQIIESLKSKSTLLSDKSARTNAYFGNNFHISDNDIKLIQSMPSLMPLDADFQDQLASGFGTRINPFHKGLHDHPGTDFVAPRGTPVNATGRGRVTEVRRNYLEAGYGNYIEINHGRGFKTRYAHLEDINVRVGQIVEKGVMIGTVGNSGGSVAPHLHYEVIRDGDNVDPVHFMIEGLTSSDHKKLTARARKQNQSLD